MTKRRPTYSAEFRERAIRLVREHEDTHASQWAAMRSIAEKLGCSRETLRNWVRRSEIDAGERAGLTTDDRQRMTELERENVELRRANEILRHAAAFFAAAELDRRPR
jgi:transposase-like protein